VAGRGYLAHAALPLAGGQKPAAPRVARTLGTPPEGPLTAGRFRRLGLGNLSLCLRGLNQLLSDHHAADNQADDNEHDAQFDERETLIFPVLSAHMLPDFAAYCNRFGRLRHSFCAAPALSGDFPEDYLYDFGGRRGDAALRAYLICSSRKKSSK
jgi:hypothetical protein